MKVLSLVGRRTEKRRGGGDEGKRETGEENVRDEVGGDHLVDPGGFNADGVDCQACEPR